MRIPVSDQVVAAVQLPMAKCIPTNNLFLGPLQPAIDQIEGGVGAMFYPLVMLMLVIAAVIAIVTILSDRAVRWIKLVVAIPAFAIVVLLVLIVFTGLYNYMNNLC